LLAAKKWKIKTVIIPKDNESDLAEIQDYIKEGLEILPISKFEEAAKIAIIKKEKTIIV
jgi:ATP-dependent proteinase. Serine peptidase. MEROPS family S16